LADVSEEDTASIIRFKKHVEQATSKNQAAQISWAPGGVEPDISPSEFQKNKKAGNIPTNQ
jgi:hypothetical protein